MFRFFRSIRKSNIRLGNSSKYLKYAVGEITLVVIGILIALQINNWNENVKLAKSEKQLYANIKHQLLEDKSIIEASIEFNDRFMNQYRYAIEQIKNKDKQNLDSLAVISVNLLEYSDYHKESNIFSLLVGSGEIKILKNKNFALNTNLNRGIGGVIDGMIPTAILIWIPMVTLINIIIIVK